MQAAGRLRKLGRNQMIVMAGGPDSGLFSKLNDIKGNNSISASERGFDATAAQVLSWAMKCVGFISYTHIVILRPCVNNYYVNCNQCVGFGWCD